MSLPVAFNLVLFDQKRNIRTKWVENQIRELHEAHPDCQFVKNDKLNIELYPSVSNPHRLPLARGRTMLLDEHCHCSKRESSDS